MKKIFVLDTNVLLSNPLAIYKFDDNDIVIPISVIEEIDTFKKDQSDIGRNAREVSRILDKLRSRGKLCEGIPLFLDREDTGTLFVELGAGKDVAVPELEDSVDNRILAIGLMYDLKDHNVVLITKDSNLRIKADAYGLAAEDFESDHVCKDQHYTGVTQFKVPSETINSCYSHNELKVEGKFKPNQFVILEDEEDPAQIVNGIYQNDKVRMLENVTDGVWGIYPRNMEQTFALRALLDDKIQLVTLSGAAGTGKTLMAIAAGLMKTTDEDVYSKMLVSRPVFPLGKDIGFLPGDLEEKMNPWMQPIFDNLELLLGGGTKTSKRQQKMGRGYQELINQGMIAVEPLTYIRGRSIPHQYFVVDEAQNLTAHEVKTILTRAGEGTKIVLTGDPHQIDNPYIDSHNNGLTYVIERFKDEAIAAHVHLQKGERSELATIATNIL